jgi:catechol 2,3-dioxygenase-like lactoylglutathione lyase family enzyme
MVDHVSLGVKNIERSRRFSDITLRPLGLVRTQDFQASASDYGAMPGELDGEFTVTAKTCGSPCMACMYAFVGPRPRSVHPFYAVRLAAGGTELSR